MKWFTALFLYTTVLLSVQAQDSLLSKSSISVNQGLSYVLIKDAYRSPFTYQGLLTQVNASYLHSGIRSIHAVRAYYASGPTKTSFSPLAQSRITQFSYDWLIRLHNTPKLSLYAGPGVNFLGWESNYFPEIHPAKIHSWYVGITAGLAAGVTYRLNNRSTFSLQANLPLAGYIDRPHLLNGAHQNTGVTFFPVWNPHLRLTWEYRFTRHVSALLQYDYTDLQSDLTRELNILGNGMSFGFRLRFGKKQK